MKKHLIVSVCLLVALFSVCFIISGSVVQAADNGDITVNNVASYFTTISNRVNTVVSSAESRIKQLYDLDKALLTEYISDAKAELESLRALKNKIQSSSTSASEKTTALNQFNSLYAELDELCNQIVISSAESRVVSARSAWHRPCEKTYADIKANVQTFKEVGINLLLVETLYHGCSAFKTDISAFPYHPSLASTYKDTEKNIVYNDYLSAFVACCKEYGIEVHAWVENFYSGINSNSGVVKQHPEWIMYNDDGSYLQRLEGGAYIFIDPANKEVQDTLIDFYNDLFKKNPDVTGLNLDYIRYPVSNRSQDTGYTEAAMKEFYESLGKEFTEAQLADTKKMINKFKKLFDKAYLYGGQSEADANYNAWVKYRTDVITDFVRRIKDEVKEPNDIILSTAVFASIAESLDSKKQDWQEWFRNGWIDIATPMAYYKSYSVVETNVKTMISLGGNTCHYYTGLASSYSGLPAWQNKEFIEASYKAGANGYVIFSSAQILGSKDVQTALKNGVNRKWAVLPHGEIDEILKASFDDILDKADRLHIPAGHMTKADRESIADFFDKISKMPSGSAYEIDLIRRSLSTFVKSDITKYVTGYSRTRMSDQLGDLVDILDTRASIELIKEGGWNPELEGTRPEITEKPILPEDPTEPENPIVPENPNEPENPTEPNEPTEPENPAVPDDEVEENGDSDGNTEPDIPDESKNHGHSGKHNKPGFFESIWLAIVNFIKKLFGIKK